MLHFIFHGTVGCILQALFFISYEICPRYIDSKSESYSTTLLFRNNFVGIHWRFTQLWVLRIQVLHPNKHQAKIPDQNQVTYSKNKCHMYARVDNPVTSVSQFGAASIHSHSSKWVLFQSKSMVLSGNVFTRPNASMLIMRPSELFKSHQGSTSKTKQKENRSVTTRLVCLGLLPIFHPPSWKFPVPVVQ